MRQTIVINELPPMLNGDNGLKRMHWATYRKVRDAWTWLIRSKKPQKHSGRVEIAFIRYSTARPDWDNLYASFKVVGDALQAAGVIRGDSMDDIVSLDASWKRASKRKYQRTKIIIEDV